MPKNCPAHRTSLNSSNLSYSHAGEMAEKILVDELMSSSTMVWGPKSVGFCCITTKIMAHRFIGAAGAADIKLQTLFVSFGT